MTNFILLDRDLLTSGRLYFTKVTGEPFIEIPLHGTTDLLHGFLSQASVYWSSYLERCKGTENLDCQSSPGLGIRAITFVTLAAELAERLLPYLMEIRPPKNKWVVSAKERQEFLHEVQSVMLINIRQMVKDLWHYSEGQLPLGADEINVNRRLYAWYLANLGSNCNRHVFPTPPIVNWTRLRTIAMRKLSETLLASVRMFEPLIEQFDTRQPPDASMTVYGFGNKVPIGL